MTTRQRKRWADQLEIVFSGNDIVGLFLRALPVIAIVALFAAQLADVRYGIRVVGPQPAWESALPALVAATDTRRPHAFPYDMLLVGLLESAVLFVLVRYIWAKPKRSDIVVSCAAALVMFALAIMSHGLTSNDVYAYLGYAKLSTMFAAYIPPNVPLPHEFGPINRIWRQPLLPCAYGPLWIAANWLELSWVPNLHVGVTVARSVNFLELVALARLIHLVATTRVALLVLLNPALMFEFVVNAHNDLLATLIVVAALVASRRGWSAVAGVLGGAAALVKLPFIVLAVAALAVEGTLRSKFARIAIIVAFGIGGSLLFGGRAYINALHTVATLYAIRPDSVRSVVTLRVHELVAMLAFAGVFIVVFSRFRPRSTPWCLSGISVAIYPSYFLWGLPCAIATGYATSFMVALPAIALIADYAFTGSSLAIQIGCVLLAIIDAGLAVTLRRNATPQLN